MNNALMNALSRSAHKALFKINQKSPEILLVASIGGAIAGTVMACKATLKAKEVVDEMKQNLELVETADKYSSEEQYSNEDKVNDLRTIYIQSGIKLAKLYAPAVGLGVLSIGGMIFSHGILRNRLGTAIAAYATLSTGFNEYRDRIAEAIGKDEELKIYHDVETYKDEEVDKNNGIVLARRKDRELVDGYSIYARCFDEYNPNWKDNAEWNLDFLRSTQKYLNSKLIRDGYLFLNDAYAELGFDKTDEGQLVGWIYDPDRTDSGDNSVSFGLYDPSKGAVLGDFINGHEKSVFLDFNVDGVILGKF